MTVDLTRWGLHLRQRSAEHGSAPEGEGGVVVGYGGGETPVFWPTPRSEAASHIVVFGSSGSGKSVMVAGAVVAELTQPQESGEQTPAVFLVDPKGDLAQLVLLALAATAPERLEDVIYLDPFDPRPFGFNLNHLSLGKTPLDIRAMQLAGLVSEVSTATGSQRHLGVGARQVDLLTHVILGALGVPHPRASLLLALEALADQKSLRSLGAATKSERAKHFLETTQLGDELRVSTAARLRAALAASESLSAMIGAPSCIQFSELTAPGRIVLVDLGRPVGGLQSLQVFFANLLVRLAIEHLMERPSPWRGHHCRVVIDEAQVVAPVLSDRAETILTMGRSKGISLTTITQGTTLLTAASDTLLRVIMTNTRVKFVGRLAAPDAELLSREQAPGAGIDESLGSFRSRLTAAVTNLRDREFFYLRPGHRERFRTRGVDMRAWQEAGEREAAVIEGVKARLRVPPTAPPPLTLAELAQSTPSTGGSRKGSRGSSRRPRSRWG